MYTDLSQGTVPLNVNMNKTPLKNNEEIKYIENKQKIKEYFHAFFQRIIQKRPKARKG